jgi:hypothetical protein
MSNFQPIKEMQMVSFSVTNCFSMVKLSSVQKPFIRFLVTSHRSTFSAYFISGHFTHMLKFWYRNSFFNTLPLTFFLMSHAGPSAHIPDTLCFYYIFTEAPFHYLVGFGEWNIEH